MFEWDVVDDLPVVEPEPEESARARPWRRWLGIAAVLLAALGLTLWWRVRVAEATLREDIEQTVAREERALRLGVVDEARGLSDPSAPDEWYNWYRSTFAAVGEPLPLPDVTRVEGGEDGTLVTLAYATEAAAWQEVRFYRLVRDEWRRAPLPADRWGEPQRYDAAGIALWLAPRDTVPLPPDEWLKRLETFRAAFRAAWPDAYAGPVAVRVVPNERLTRPNVTGSQVLVRSPLLHPFSPDDLVPPARAYELALLRSIADVLAFRDVRSVPREAQLQATLLDALVRALTLTPDEHQRYRAYLRETEGLPDYTFTGGAVALHPLVADYLVTTEGPDFPARLLRLTDGFLAERVRQATGRTLREVTYSAVQWVESQQLPPVALQAGGVASGRLLGVSSRQPLRLEVVVDQGAGRVVTLTVDDEAALNVPRTCLARGDSLLFHLREWEEGAGVADDVAVVERNLPPIPLDPMPPDSRVLITRAVADGLQLIALNDEGRETLVGRLPAAIDPVTDQVGPHFAFLLNDPCGTSIYEYDPTSGSLHRLSVPLRGAGRLFWTRGRLFLVEQGEESWRLFRVERSMGLRVQAEHRGRFMGFFLSRGSYLASDEAGFFWVDAGAPDTVARIDFNVGENMEIGALSHDARWLAYSVHHPQGTSNLKVLDLLTMRPYELDLLEPNQAYGQMAWSPGELPILAAVVGNLGGGRRAEGNTLVRYQLPSTISFALSTQRTQDAGEIDNLHWCLSTYHLFYRLSTEAGTTLVEEFGNDSAPLTEGDEVLWCRGP